MPEKKLNQNKNQHLYTMGIIRILRIQLNAILFLQ